MRGWAAIVFVLLLGLPPFSPPTRADSTSSSILLTDDAYETEVTEYQGTASTAYVVVRSLGPDGADRTPTRDLLDGVRVQGDADPAGFYLDLLETGPATGTFYGSFGFADATDRRCEEEPHPFLGRITGDCRIRVDATRSNTITVSRPGDPLLSAKTVTWTPTHTASLKAFAPSGEITTVVGERTVLMGYAAAIVIQVADPDLNRRGDAETYPSLVRATSTSETGGELVPLLETRTPGLFEGHIRLEASPTPANGRLFVRNGDAIGAVYDESLDATGEPSRRALPITGTWKFATVEEGSVAVDRPFPSTYWGASTPAGSDPSDAFNEAWITVVDADEDTGPARETLTVRAASGAGATTDVLLTETAHQPGTFGGALRFSTTCDPCPPGTLRVGTGAPPRLHDQAVVTYSDRRNPGGVLRVRQADLAWRATQTAELRLEDGAALIVGSGRDHELRVDDWDANTRPDEAETVTAWVLSTTDPAGVPVPLRETGPDTGIFSGTFRISTSSPAPAGTLRAADGDQVTARYDDDRDEQGASRTIISRPDGAPAFAYGTPATFRTSQTATASLDATEYYLQGTEANPSTVANAFVADPDRNDPLAVDTINALVATLKTPSCGAATPPLRSLPITLREIGVDSGLFHAELRFEPETYPFAAAPFGANSIPVCATGPTTFRLEYWDLFQSMSDSGGFLASEAATFAGMGPGSAPAARLEMPRVGIDGTTHYERANQPILGATITVAGYGPSAADALTARVETSTCSGTQGVSVTLSRSGGEDQRRTGQASFVVIGGPSCPTGSAVGIRQGDTVTVSIGTSTFTALPVSGATESLSFRDRAQLDLSSLRGENAIGYLRFSGGPWNEDKDRRDLVRVHLASARNPTTPTLLYLAETDANTGLFTGSFRPATGGPLDEERRVVVSAQSFSRSQLGTDNEDPGGPGGDLHDVVQVRQADASGWADSLTWRAAADVALSATGLAWTGATDAATTVTVNGDDASTGRIMNSALSSGNGIYAFAAPFIPGTELVYVPETFTETWTQNRATPITYTVGAAAGGAAEAITDRNRDGAVTCAADVTVTLVRTVSRAGGGTMDQTPIAITCTSVSPATGAVVLDVGGNCNFPASGAVDTGGQLKSCRLTLTTEYRARPASNPADRFHYGRGSSTQATSQVRFSQALPSGDNTIRIDFTPAAKPVLVQSVSASGQILETETITAWFQGGTSFLATFGYETSNGGTNQKLRVGPGSTRIEVSFLDPFPALDTMPGSAVVHPRTHLLEGLWRPATDGLLQLLSADFAGAAPDPFYGLCAPVRILDLDADRTPRPDSLQIQARAADDPATAASVLLTETGSSTGVFTGIIPVHFATGGGTDRHCDPATDEVGIGAGGATLIATYLDARPATGPPALRDAAIAWKPSRLGSLTLYAAETDLPTSAETPSTWIRGADAGLRLRLFDPDANRNPSLIDTVPVRASSDTDPTGRTIILSETGPNTGEFLFSPLRFAPPAVDAARLNATFGDLITVTYDDPQDDQGRPASTPRASTRWVRAYDGQVAFDFGSYTGRALRDAAPGQRLAQAYGHPGEVPMVQVIVPDGDLNQDPRRVERLEGADLHRLRIGTPNSQGDVTTSAAVRLTRLLETGANTGVFLGVFGFREGPGVPKHEELGLPNGYARIPVTHGTAIAATYADPLTASGRSASTFRASAAWYEPGLGVLSLDAPRYRIGDTVQVSLSDSDLAGNMIADAVSLRVRAASHEQEIAVVVTEDARHGVLRGEFRLGTAPATGTLRVSSPDAFTVTYRDASPAGPRAATASVEGDYLPPETLIQADPPEPDGANGYYRTSPTIAFLADPDTVSTTYRIGATGPERTYDAPFQLPQGNFTIRFHSTDKYGLTENPRTAEFRVDLANPTQTPANLTASAAAGGSVRLAWSAVPGTSDPFHFNNYSVYRDGTEIPVGSSTTTQFVDASLDDEAPHRYKVAILDASGRRGPWSATVQATPDRTPPNLSAAIATPTRFDVRLKPFAISVTAVATDAHLSAVTAELQTPSGETLAAANLTGAGPRRTGSVPLDNATRACTCVLRVAVRDQAGNTQAKEINITIDGPDEHAPQIRLLPSPAEVAQGDPLILQVSDDVALATLSYAIDDGFRTGVPIAPNATNATATIATLDLEPGPHQLAVTATDRATDVNGDPRPNTASAHLRFFIAPRDAARRAYGLLPTSATAWPDGTVLVAWTLPEELRGRARGFQVWRGASPFRLIDVIEDPDARDFVDRTAAAHTTYRYAVTYYLAAPISESAFQADHDDGGTPIEAAEISTPASSPLPSWFSNALIGSGVIVALALAAALFVQRKPTLAEPPAPTTILGGPQPPPTALSPRVHRIRCPSCSHRFQATGPKPIRTTCENCGRTGILR